MNEARHQADVPGHWAVLRDGRPAEEPVGDASGADNFNVPSPETGSKDHQNPSKITIFACSRTLPENLLTAVPSICKNERGHELTFWPVRRTSPRPIPLKAVD